MVDTFEIRNIKRRILRQGDCMENLYKQLGFKQPEYVKNPYGIRIYIGEKDKDDWCVVIPKELVKAKCNWYNCKNDYAVYLITEKHALGIAREYTEFAKKLKGET